MPSNNITAPHTAITTWSGFIYQGKVAIHHTLKLLETIDKCEDYVLQLDSLEDFSILNSSGKIQSMHQVKAWGTQHYSSYKKAFGDTTTKATEQSCTKVFFHLAREIKDKTVPQIQTDHTPLIIYTYGEDAWCPVDEIDQKIEEQLKLLGDNPTKKSDEYVCRAREALDQIVTKQVLKIHRMNHDDIATARSLAYNETINFSEFQEVLNRDVTQDGQGDGYFFYKLLIDLNRYYQNYCIRQEEDPNWDEDKAKKLSLYMKKIGELHKEEMITFIQNIIPHRNFTFDTLKNYKDDTFSQDGIQYAFLATLNELKETSLSSNMFFLWSSNGKFYTPTTIHTASRNASEISELIITNAEKNNPSIMFESNNLITTDINVASIAKEAPTVISAIEDNPNNITRYGTISLISLDAAKGEIND